MLSAFARALETVLGPALGPAASLLRVLAVLTLLAAIVTAGVAMTRAIAAWRYGWTPAVLVRCPRCGKIASDPAVAACPDGHPVRFPASAGRRLGPAPTGWRRGARALYPIVFAAAAGAAAVFLYFGSGVDRTARPVATITASLAYLFFAAALAASAYALSPRPVGGLARLLHAGLAVACLLPAFVLAWLARGFEPAVEREIGSLWTTPTALYVAAGSRARREGAAVERLDALSVDARFPGFGILWEGLEGFHAAGVSVPWRGRGGLAARLAVRWLRPSASADSLFTRSVQTLALQPNRRVHILATREHVRFVPDP
jgi:hypothetical protein